VPFGVLGVPGAPGTVDAPGVGAGLAGVAGGPIGADPEPVPFFFGKSAPGALVPGCEPGTGEAGCARTGPVRSAAAIAAGISARMYIAPIRVCGMETETASPSFL
jgi:hypothetical protein